MRSKLLLMLTLAVPLLVLACNRAEQSPSAAAPGQAQENQARAPDSPEKILQGAPPAAGQPSPSPSGTPAMPAPENQGSPSSPPAPAPNESR